MGRSVGVSMGRCSLPATFGVLLLSLANVAAAGEIARASVDSLLALPVGARDAVAGLPQLARADAQVTLERIDVYAPDARVLVVGEDGATEAPRSTLRHFLGRTADGERIALSLAADGSSAQGVMLGRGTIWVLSGQRNANGALAIDAKRSDAPNADGEIPLGACAGDKAATPKDLAALAQATPKGVETVASAKVANRQVTVAVDTDNEVMNLKFSNNTTNATNYVAALFAGMNVLYEDNLAGNGLEIRLLIGTTILRPSTTPDPYPSTSATPIDTQLNEFGNQWRLNQTGVSRGFAMMLSGKSDNPNGSSGIAWLVTSGSYCAATGQVLPGGDVFGHYSVTRVFLFPGSLPAYDTYVVSHELGHNFGAEHTHCTDTSGAGGLQPIDQCFNGEGAFGCYNGAEVCPASGPGAPAGTLMSYCHLNNAGPGGQPCGVVEEFHPVHVTQLDARIDSQPTSCVGPLGGPPVNDPPQINAPASIDVVEDVPRSLSPITVSDPDSAAGAITVTYNVASGTLAASSGGGVTVGGSATNLTLTGTVAAIGTFLAGNNLTWTTPQDSTENATLTVLVNDNGNTGTGGALSDTENVLLQVGAANDAPTVAAPAAIAVTEDVATSLTGITFADVDAEGFTANVVLSVPSGAISATPSHGVSVGGTASARTLVGAITNLNAFLAAGSVRFTTASNATAPVTLAISINDNGASGAGGALIANRNVTLNVSAVNDAPVIGAPVSIVVPVSGPGALEGITLSDVDSGASAGMLDLAVSGGTLAATAGGGVTVTGAGTPALTLTGTIPAIDAFLRGTPPSYTGGDTTLTLTANDGGGSGSGGAQGASAPVQVLASILLRDGFE